jgi:hypothetical protein
VSASVSPIRRASTSTGSVVENRLEVHDGELWRVRVVDGAPKTRQPVCNFVPEVVERVETRDAVGQVTVSFVLDLHTASGVTRVEATDANLLAFLADVPGLVSHEGRERTNLRRAVAESAVDKPTTRRYAHTGWVVDPVGRNVFLHAGGAIGADGPVGGMRTDCGDRLANYALPDPPRNEDLRAVIRTAVDAFLAAGDRNVMLVLLAAVARALLGAAPTYMVFLSGPTGSGKTSLARFATAWFGPNLAHKDAKTWSFMGTPYALQKALSDTCGVAVLVDEYLGTRDHQRTVELLGRAVTGAVRDRLDSNLGERPAYAPNAMVIATGETNVERASLVARTVTVECTPSMRAPAAQFRQAEHAALDGLFALAMAAYVKHLAAARDRRGVDQAGMPYGWADDRAACAAQVDAAILDDPVHPRAADNVVDLLAALTRFLVYAIEAGAYTDGEARALRRDALRALLVPLDTSAFDEAAQAVAMLRDMLLSGRCHLTTRSGAPPTADSHLYGWTTTTGAFTEPRPGGKRIGYLDGNRLYLIPGALIDELRSAQQRLGVEPTFTHRQLGRLFHERGWILKTHRGYGQRITIGGKQHDVWPIAVDLVFATAEGDPDHAAAVALVRDQLGAHDRE